MKIVKKREDYWVIHLDGFGDHEMVKLEMPSERRWGTRNAEVNWSCVGSVSPDEATAFAKAVLKAASIARLKQKQFDAKQARKATK